MTTNYFWITNRCSECGREDRVHVGTEWTGWPFLFHGYREHPTLGVLESAEDWRKVFANGNGKLMAGACDCEIEDPVSWAEKLVKDGKSAFSGSHSDNARFMVGVDPEGYQISFHEI